MSILYHNMVIVLLLVGFGVSVFAGEPILPVAAPVGLNAGKVALGERLFHEVKLSADGQVSCASCHSLASGGVDGLVVSTGVYGRQGKMNAATVFNSALNFRQFWNGRVVTLEEQIDGSITNPVEMGNTWEQVLVYLQNTPAYEQSFSKLYEDGVSVENVQHSIAEFEKSLTLTGSRFDQYLEGDTQAITAEEEHGYQLFKAYGCVSCHQGAGVGGNMFHKIGVVDEYFTEHNQQVKEVDLGRFLWTDNPSDKYVFKVPSLRLVVLTAPYFHDGSIETLGQAIKIMGEHQLGRNISEQDVLSMVLFLGTLTGEYQGKH